METSLTFGNHRLKLTQFSNTAKVYPLFIAPELQAPLLGRKHHREALAKCIGEWATKNTKHMVVITIFEFR